MFFRSSFVTLCSELLVAPSTSTEAHPSFWNCPLASARHFHIGPSDFEGQRQVQNSTGLPIKYIHLLFVH